MTVWHSTPNPKQGVKVRRLNLADWWLSRPSRPEHIVVPELPLSVRILHDVLSFCSFDSDSDAWPCEFYNNFIT